MVQESTNTFSDGLIKDLNPLTTPNTVLTDALNATLLTFNGNELVLQNDMGNTKITGAKLPEGYVPLGIKEFGGILYIVSSNGENIEIGSFPSPEMVNTSLSKIDPKTLDIFINSNDNKINKNIKLSTSSFKSGDNFLIILDTIQDESFISNYDTRKIYKPKLISISNGVELDITNTLTQQKTINITDKYYSWFIDDNPSKLNIDLFKSKKITQIYKSRKSGEIYLRFDLENIDKFYLNNTINNTSAYPVISKGEDNNYHLKFSFYIKNDSYIRCNKISLKYTLTDLDTGIDTPNTIIAKLAYLFIYGLTYDTGSIVCYNNTYYRSIKLHSNEELLDDLFWTNLGNYEAAVREEPLLKPYSSNNQYDDIFDINLGTNRNQLINYEITPLNTLFGLSFDDFTITDNLDLSKDNISWVLSPYWRIIPEFYNCEEDVSDPNVGTGYIIYDVVAKFGKDSSGAEIALDNDDLPLIDDNKQAIIIREGSDNQNYINYNIISKFKLDGNYDPIFDSNLFVTLPKGTKFRIESGECTQRYTMAIEHSYSISDDTSFTWPIGLLPYTATNELTTSAKENAILTTSFKISNQIPDNGDFGTIELTYSASRVIEWWEWRGELQTEQWYRESSSGYGKVTYVIGLEEGNENQIDTHSIPTKDKFVVDTNNSNRIGIVKFTKGASDSYTYEYKVTNPEKFKEGNPTITILS